MFSTTMVWPSVMDVEVARGLVYVAGGLQVAGRANRSGVAALAIPPGERRRASRADLPSR